MLTTAKMDSTKISTRRINSLDKLCSDQTKRALSTIIGGWTREKHNQAQEHTQPSQTSQETNEQHDYLSPETTMALLMKRREPNDRKSRSSEDYLTEEMKTAHYQNEVLCINRSANKLVTSEKNHHQSD